MNVARWTSKTRHTLSEYVIIIAFPLQQWLNERALVLHYANCLSFWIVTAGFRTLTPHVTNVLFYFLLFNDLAATCNSAARSALNPIITFSSAV
jgi:hypothetical protein